MNQEEWLKELYASLQPHKLSFDEFGDHYEGMLEDITDSDETEDGEFLVWIEFKNGVIRGFSLGELTNLREIN